MATIAQKWARERNGLIFRLRGCRAIFGSWYVAQGLYTPWETEIVSQIDTRLDLLIRTWKSGNEDSKRAFLRLNKEKEHV